MLWMPSSGLLWPIQVTCWTGSPFPIQRAPSSGGHAFDGKFFFDPRRALGVGTGWLGAVSCSGHNMALEGTDGLKMGVIPSV